MLRTATTLLDPSLRHGFLLELSGGHGLVAKLLGTIGVMAVGATIYGAILGSWHGGMMIRYTAIKLPLVLILTSLFTLVLNWLLARLLGMPLAFAQVAVSSFLALAVAAVVLASLAPVAWFFTATAPPPSAAARATHNLLYLLHTLMVGGAGLAGTRVLWWALCEMGERRRVRRVWAAWLLAFAFVGGEVAWALRPFVGSIYYEMAFLRPDALDGNVYEFILFDILPYLWGT